MLIDMSDYHGHDVKLDPTRVIKLRPAVVMGDPIGTTLVDFASGGFFATGDLRANWAILGCYVRFALLHAPDGTEVLINADGIAAVQQPDPAYADSGSVAIVSKDFENQYVRSRNHIPFVEKVADVQAALANAALLKPGQTPTS